MGLKQEWTGQAQTLTADALQQSGKVLIIAPHQDDESLGCGGLIALLRKADIPVQVVFTTDGSLSHPNSVKFPALELMALRESEAIKALKILGVGENQIMFLRWKDGRVPARGSRGFENAVHQMQQVLMSAKPQTVITPWQRDPHPDHRATWQITDAALQQSSLTCRRLEYLIWLWERAAPADLPLPGEMQVWKIDISAVTQQKQQAIAAHVSQTTRLIDDDPEGFILSPEVLNHFAADEEIFVERNS